MAVKGLKTCDDIVSYLEYIDKKYVQLEDELKGIKIGLFTSGKAKLKARKEKIKAELERYSDIYDYYDNFFAEATTFDRKDLSPFLAKYFTLFNGKTYEVQRGVKDVSDSKYAKSCDFIASSDDFNRIDKKYDLNAPVRLDNVIDMCKDDCLSLGGTKTHVLLEDAHLSSEFSAYPEIIAVAKRLVDLKISHPDLTDKERLSAVLRDLSTENELRHEEAILASEVSEEMKPKITIRSRSDQPSASAPKIDILRRSDEPSGSAPKIDILRRSDQERQPVKPVRPVVAASTRSVQPSAPSVNTGARDTLHTKTDEEAMREAIARALMNVQSTVVADADSFVVKPVVKKEESAPQGERKLSKTIMGRYINR